MDKLKKNSKIKETSVLSKSKFFNEKDMVPTPVPMVNVALSGDINGGLTPGLTVLAGPSKHFKTSFALLMAAAYLDKYEDAVMLFYDSEFGSPQSYFEAFGIDTSRVLHTPIKDAEELKFDIMGQLENIERNDKVIVVIDSIGNLASKKEKEDALNEKSVADMTRARALKSLFRMVTPYLTMNDIPMIAINHTYKEIGLFPKDVVSGGTGIYYSADNIWIIGRRQEKDGTEIKGYHFIVNIEKSRYVKEKSKIPISVSWEGGIQTWSGLIDLAVEGGFVHKGKKGRSTGYAVIDQSTGEIDEKVYYERETMNEEFWMPILEDTKFSEFISGKYKIVYESLTENVDEGVIEE
jgi:RecA/RadA recombinase